VLDPNNTTAKISGLLIYYRYDIISFIRVKRNYQLMVKCLCQLMEAGESEVEGCWAKSVIAYVLTTEYMYRCRGEIGGLSPLSWSAHHNFACDGR
jgi:hypothetical protein